MLENDPLSRVSLPRALTQSRLFRQSNARRLFKARHLELEQIDLRTRIVSITSEESVAPITVYAVMMRHRQTNARASLSHETPWVLEHRYSEFRAFRTHLLALVQEWEASAENAERETKEFMAMSNALRRPFTNDFPRRHLRVDTLKIIEERRAGLQEFVRKLLCAYVDVSVYLLECVASMSPLSHASMTSLSCELEAFLDVPASQKEMERHITAVIRAMTDIREEDPTEDAQGSGKSDGYECCICMNDGCVKGPQVRLPGEDNLVQLPCQHHFHEDCVIDWFSTSMTCPLCRQQVITPAPGALVHPVTQAELA